ncbi:MAG TPA: Sec-independent protein translocase subunit TatA [Kineosporiaceae bacterium]|nr:Sec-independent protein translocase subunit TatA [Kineosporiaceae bacterium]
MFRALEPWHLIILVLVVVLLFGGRRLPDAARGLGRSLRIFKSEMKQMQDEAPRPAARPTEPIEGPYEGRVVDEQHRAATPSDSQRDV